MRFVYHADAGAPEVEIEGESFIHIFGSRRTKASETLALRNLRDDMLHTYAIISINRKSAHLRLESSARTPCKMSRFTHIIWAITHPQTIQKALPYLNELGLSRLSLFWSEFSQKNAKIELEKLRRILIGSCEQCGRSDMMEIEILRDLDEVLARYERACALDFGGEVVSGVKSGAESSVDFGADSGSAGARVDSSDDLNSSVDSSADFDNASTQADFGDAESKSAQKADSGEVLSSANFNNASRRADSGGDDFGEGCKGKDSRAKDSSTKTSGAESISSLLSGGIIIGAEGGFSKKEREKFASRRVIALDSSFILRSQTAAIAILSKGL
ncbi:hypothetical protein BKN38_00290 [Helicobacter sp. CLO-3]|uniref:RsmE family RNA methyltransferase n=1 Tax=unclassified Helicobacter TaxID=2593540 RepID=UPI000805409E|nr:MULTISPECIES: RsmE family RNA methyltransferase [unclassified Helicobacter]OBV30022.1 hypothetical protein BA723_03100 [Helicobacter sp. CLO-3]OHU85877.1 hypothetical protein BKN38_00290 [Helicobacter sp. CLO-3]